MKSLPQAHDVTVACAGLQSTLFIWLNVWYISHLVKRPYISGRNSQTFGDPLNDADMLTTRVFVWSSTLLALSSAFGVQQDGGSEKAKAAIMNVLCGVILIALIWPQRLLFLGLRQSVQELWSRERSVEEEATKLVVQMMKAKSALEVFTLQRELLKRNDLSAIERARWTSKVASSLEESGTQSNYCCRFNMWSACSEKLGNNRAGRIALRILRLLVGGAVVAATVGTAYAALQCGVLSYPDAGSQYVWVSTAVLSAVLSEVLRVRWNKAHEKTSLDRHSSNVSGDTGVTALGGTTGEGVSSEKGSSADPTKAKEKKSVSMVTAVISEVLRVRLTKRKADEQKTALDMHSSNVNDTVDEKGILGRRKSEQKAVELIEVRVGSVGSVETAAKNGKADESKGGATQVVIINPMTADGRTVSEDMHTKRGESVLN